MREGKRRKRRENLLCSAQSVNTCCPAHAAPDPHAHRPHHRPGGAEHMDTCSQPEDPFNPEGTLEIRSRSTEANGIPRLHG